MIYCAILISIFLHPGQLKRPLLSNGVFARLSVAFHAVAPNSGSDIHPGEFALTGERLTARLGTSDFWLESPKTTLLAASLIATIAG
jgi:hypothetical protein